MKFQLLYVERDGEFGIFLGIKIIHKYQMNINDYQSQKDFYSHRFSIIWKGHLDILTFLSEVVKINASMHEGSPSGRNCVKRAIYIFIRVVLWALYDIKCTTHQTIGFTNKHLFQSTSDLRREENKTNWQIVFMPPFFLFFGWFYKVYWNQGSSSCHCSLNCRV